jgi:hypothetical protein
MPHRRGLAGAAGARATECRPPRTQLVGRGSRGLHVAAGEHDLDVARSILDRATGQRIEASFASRRHLVEIHRAREPTR